MARETRGFSERFPSLIKGSRAGKPPFLPLNMLVRVWFAWVEMSWSCCSGLMQSCLQTLPLCAWGDACSSLSCCKLDFCFAAISSLIYHPDTLLPMQDLSLSLLHSGNYSFYPEEHLKRPSPHPLYSEHRWERYYMVQGPFPGKWIASAVSQQVYWRKLLLKGMLQILLLFNY